MGNNGNKAFYHLQIKTEKVQSFIFKNPKLKYMLGANSLIGEFFSSELINIKKKVEPNCGFFSTVGSGSHLKGHFDNIYSNFANDIISSAGGHFEAVFGDKNNLEKFLKEVLDHIDDKLPGLKIGYRVRRLDDNMRIDLFDKEESLDIDIPDSGCLLRYDSPYFYLCPEDGTNPKNTKYRASEETHIIEEQGNEFYNLNTSDYLTKFYKNKNYLNKKRLFNKDKYELETIAKSSLLKNKNMIAVIKIDGNGMGNRFTKFKEKLKDKPLKEAFVEIEKFWWTNRETLRVALKNTINELKIESDDKNNDDTYLIMMLGGDDILIVTVPEIAIDLVKTFSKKLNESHTEAFNKIYNSKESNKTNHHDIGRSAL